MELRDGVLTMIDTPTGIIASTSGEVAVPLKPVAPDVFVAMAPTGVELPVVFFGGNSEARYLHTGMRAAARVRNC